MIEVPNSIRTLDYKLTAGLQKLMSDARTFSLCEISRNALFSENRETQQVPNISFITLVLDESV